MKYFGNGVITIESERAEFVMSIDAAVAGFRASLFREVASPTQFEPAAKPSEIANLERDLVVEVPPDLRELWAISAFGPWVFSSELYRPAAVSSRLAVWKDIQMTWEAPDSLSGQLLPIGGAGGGAVMYALDGPSSGAISYVHPQEADRSIRLADSLEAYINVASELADLGLLRVEAAGLPERLIKLWNLPDDDQLPEPLRQRLGIGTEFY